MQFEYSRGDCFCKRTRAVFCQRVAGSTHWLAITQFPEDGSETDSSRESRVPSCQSVVTSVALEDLAGNPTIIVCLPEIYTFTHALGRPTVTNTVIDI